MRTGNEMIKSGLLKKDKPFEPGDFYDDTVFKRIMEKHPHLFADLPPLPKTLASARAAGLMQAASAGVAITRAEDKIVVSGFRHFFDTADGPVQATDYVDLAIRAGEFVTLVGPSGCGKTTLLKAIAGFIRPTEGTIHCDGKPVRGPGRDRGVVFQELAILPWRTVRRNIGHGLEIIGVPRAEREQTGQAPDRAHRAGRLRGSLSARALRRHEAARCGGAHLGGRSRRDPDGRAVRGGRRHDAADAAGGTGAAVRRHPQDRVLHHP